MVLPRRPWINKDVRVDFRDGNDSFRTRASKIKDGEDVDVPKSPGEHNLNINIILAVE